MTDSEQQQLEQLAKEVVSTPSLDTTVEKKVQEDLMEKEKEVREETLEDILSRHRKEERELNNKTIALKKSVPKNNKSKRREINSQISDLEYNLRQNQQQEIRKYHAKQSGVDIDTVQDELEEEDGISLDTLNRLTLEEEPVAPSSSPNMKSFVKKPNKAKLKKEKREKEMQRLREEAEKEAENQVDMGKLESDAILELLVPMKLQVQEITADGHCLYNAISAQLLKQYDDQCTYQELRKLTAEYMRQHPDEFIPFLYKDDGDIFGLDDFEKYCNDIESTPRWGGQLEILALSKAKKVPIHIIQMGAPVLKVNEEEFPGKKPLKLAYHKHLYSLGAHYNSLLDL